VVQGETLEETCLAALSSLIPPKIASHFRECERLPKRQLGRNHRAKPLSPRPAKYCRRSEREKIFGGMPSSVKRPAGRRVARNASGEATALVLTGQHLPCPQSPGGIRDRPARVPAHEERGEGGPGRQPLCVRPAHRSREGDGAEGEEARESRGARDPAGIMASPIIRVSICEGSFGEPVF
jgi:hypothetical protein